MLFSFLERYSARLRTIERRWNRTQEALGRIEARQLSDLKPDQIHAAEFSVYSQWGEDGIVQHLLHYIPISQKVFVEFGVENYTEANTRFLLVNDNWTGVVMDGARRTSTISSRTTYPGDSASRRNKLLLPGRTSTDLIRDNGIHGEIGLLSIDIDGNDYWVWEAIDVVTPAIVIVEYNHRFGSERAVAVPYSADFQRSNAHHSLTSTTGASLAALCRLGNRKGYAFVGCTTAGNDAFFVRRDLNLIRFQSSRRRQDTSRGNSVNRGMKRVDCPSWITRKRLRFWRRFPSWRSLRVSPWKIFHSLRL